MTKTNNKGFTLIELLVVIAIIGVLTTIAVISLADVRTKARDTKRTTDLKQIGTALETYFAEYGYYPTIITPGEPLASPDGTTTYIAQIPSNPTPREDNGCPNADYAYTPSDNYTSYTLSCCLGTNVSDLPAGTVTYTPSGWSGSGEFPFANCGDNLTYGGESYPTVQIGTQCWFKKNLNYGTMISGGVETYNPQADANAGVIQKYCFNDNIDNCTDYGGLYQWHTAMAFAQSCDAGTGDCTANTPHQGICPDGWHVSTDDDYKILEMYLGMSQAEADAVNARGTHNEGYKLAGPSLDCYDSDCFTSGFDAQGAGMYNWWYWPPYNNMPLWYYSGARLLTATAWSGSTSMTTRYLYGGSKVSRYTNTNKKMAQSVRCLQD